MQSSTPDTATQQKEMTIAARYGIPVAFCYNIGGIGAQGSYLQVDETTFDPFLLRSTMYSYSASTSNNNQSTSIVSSNQSTSSSSGNQSTSIVSSNQSTSIVTSNQSTSGN